MCGQNQINLPCTQNSALEIARRQSDSPAEVAAWGSLGNAHRLQGEYEQAIQDYQQAINLTQQALENTVVLQKPVLVW